MKYFDPIIDYYNYIVQEDYYGKIIDVKVYETWSYDGIVNVCVSCPKYDSSSRFLGHKGIFNRIDGSVVINRLTVDNVHDMIFKEFFIAEENICREMGEEHDMFSQNRIFDVIVEYKNKKIVISFMMSPNSDLVLVSYPSSAQINSFSMMNNEFRKAIFDEIERCKNLIDDGYDFPKVKDFKVSKKKIKSLL